MATAATGSHQEDIGRSFLAHVLSLLLSSSRSISVDIAEYTFARLHPSELLYCYYMRVVGGRTFDYEAHW
jgi:hypothetical protein